MKINLHQPFKDTNGQDAREGEKPLTYADVAIRALNTLHQGEMPSPEDLFKRGELISKIQSGATDYTIDEASRIKDSVAKIALPFLFFQFSNLIEGAKNGTAKTDNA